MTPTLVDRTGAASRAAAEGQFAVMTGDTLLARQKYDEAARVLEREATAARSATDVHLLRFLAASNYFRGGLYGRALKLTKRIEERHLPKPVRPLFLPFDREVRRRAEPGHAAHVQQALLQALGAGDGEAILALLKQHAMLLKPGPLAFLRAVACDLTREHEAATRFYQQALLYEPDDDSLYCSSAAELFRLMRDGTAAELTECLEWRLRLIPHALIHATAALIRFQLDGGDAADPTSLQSVVDHAKMSVELHEHSSAPVARSQNIRDAVVAALSLAQVVASRQGQLEVARELADSAVAVDPSSPVARVDRGLSRWIGPRPSSESLADFREAIRIGAESHIPYTLLAQDAMSRRDATAAIPLIESALRYRADPRTQAALHSWLAICADVTEDVSRDPDALFRRAVTLDPTNQVIADNYREYKQRSRHWQFDQGTASTVRAARASWADERKRQFNTAKSWDDQVERRARRQLKFA